MFSWRERTYVFLEGENPSTFVAWVLSLQTSLFPKHDLGLCPKNPDAAQGASWLRYKKFTTITVFTPHRVLRNAKLVARIGCAFEIYHYNSLHAHRVLLKQNSWREIDECL